MFRWNRYENRSRVNLPSRKAPWAAEALLDLGTGFGSGGVSRANSPPPNEDVDPVDAGAVALETDARTTSNSSDLTPKFPPNFSNKYTTHSILDPSPSGHLAEPDPFAVPEAPPLISLLEQRRWADLDYQWDRGQNSAPNATAGGYGLSALPDAGDDFSRFLEQAGIAVTDETDPFAWPTRAE